MKLPTSLEEYYASPWEVRQAYHAHAMAPFDRLPKEVREACHNTKWGVTWVDAEWLDIQLKSGMMTSKDAVAWIKEKDK